MIEVAAYRPPESNNVMDTIQQKAVTWKALDPRPVLHWGLENDQVDHAFLAQTPLGAQYKAGMTRLEAFKAVREFLRNENPSVSTTPLAVGWACSRGRALDLSSPQLSGAPQHDVTRDVNAM